MTGIMDGIQAFLGEILYTLLVHPFFFVINLADNIFRALAGIDNSTQLIGSEATKDAIDLDGGVVYDLLKNDLIKKIFIAILVLAIFLLIIFTVMAFLKNVYTQKQKTSKEILSNSLKGLIYFIFVPVCTLLGVYLGNIVLKAVNGATSNGGGSSIVGTLFIAGAYNANQWRNGEELKPEDKTKLKNFAENYGYKNLDAIDNAMTAEEFANVVDDVFASADEKESIYWLPHVEQYYDTISFNFLIIIVGGCFIAYVMCSLAFAMARRIYIMLIWFVISPACCAMFPIDEGKMVGKYKDEMTKQVLSAYGAVAGVNLFLSIMPLIDNIKITSLAAGASGVVNMFMQIAGLLCVKEIVSALSSLVGGEDALAKGSSLMKSTTGAIKKYGGGAVKKTVSTGTKLVGNFKRYGALGIRGGLLRGNPTTWKYSGLGGALSMGANAITKGLFGFDLESDVVKNFRDTTKSEKEEMRTVRAKAVKKGYIKEHEKEIRKGMSADTMVKLVDDGADSGFGFQELVDELVEKHHINPDEEKEIRKKYTQKRQEIAEWQSNKAMYGAQVTSSINNAVDDFGVKQAVATAAKKAATAAGDKIAEEINKLVTLSLNNGKNGKEKISDANSEAMGDIKKAIEEGNSANLVKAANSLKVDATDANLKIGIKNLQEQALKGSDDFAQQESASAALATSTDKLIKVLDDASEKFASTTDEVKTFKENLKSNTKMTADDLKTVVKTLTSIINTGSKPNESK